MASDASGSSPPAARFHRRAVLYAQMDRDLFDRTRFFGAAALTNKVLARLFEFQPAIVSTAGGILLGILGDSLEQLNLHLADTVRQGNEAGPTLDRHLVLVEQRAAQIRWRNSDGATAERKAVEGELNDLLNASHVLSLFARFWRESRDFSVVLAALRIRIGGPLDFGNESHRVGIGCALIDHLRGSHELVGREFL
jgi:hypothetical protein